MVSFLFGLGVASCVASSTHRVVVVRQEVVLLCLEVLDYLVKLFNQALHALHLVRGQRLELVDSREHIDELVDPPAEEIKLAEDLRLAEIKLLALGHGKKFVLGAPVHLLVGVVEVDAGLERDLQLFLRVEIVRW